MRLKFLLPVTIFLLLISSTSLIAQDQPEAKAKDGKQAEKQDELTLEKLYPKKSIFGPSASSTSFSPDCKYAAYLYRPNKERRHGSDIWLYEVATGKTVRITSAAIMSQFQKSSRKVCDDRVEKAKKGKKDEDKKKDNEAKKDETKKEVKKDKKATPQPEEAQAAKKNNKDRAKTTKKKNKAKKAQKNKDRKAKAAKKDKEVKVTEKVEEVKTETVKKDEEDLREYVSDKDADDEKAPRYGGISTVKWSPVSNRMLFTSAGDIYSYDIETKTITRLTKTNSHESSVAFLPDDAGYTYKVDSKLMKVKFGSHLVEQLDPKFPNGEVLSTYKISPDGKRIAFVAYKWGADPQGSSSTVDIANYRNRFMKSKEHKRQTADMPFRPSDRIFYLYEINDPADDKSILKEVHRGTLKLPRDLIGTPQWSEDSKRIVFYTYNQQSDEINLFEAGLKEKKTDDNTKEKKVTDKDTKAGSDNKGDDEKKEKIKAEEIARKKAQEEDIFNAAKIVHRFMHTGGPTTPKMTDPRYLADNRSIVYLSEQTGFRHLHVLDPLYESTRSLTNGHFEVYPGKLSRDRKWMFVTATKEHPSRKEIYRISMEDGEMIRLSIEDGNYTSVAVSQDGTKSIASFITFGQTRELVFIDTNTATQKKLTDSHSENAKKLVEPKPEFFDFPNRHGHKIYGHMFKPDDWQKDVKRPLLIYIYGGPLGSRKMVDDGSFQSSAYFFAYYMAKKHGYITCTIDPRGNSGYGGVFEKANYDRVGKPQVEDIVDGVKYLIENFGVDKDRVALHGWSFGGFQTQMCLYTKPDVFAAGIAGAGPTEWENYNSWYTTGTINLNHEGKTHLEKFSLLPLAKNLKSKLLLVHGMEDSNVLYQDTVRVYRELLKAGKETLVEIFLDPTGGHGLGGDIKPLNKFRKYEDFLLRTIGTGKPEKIEKDEKANKETADKSKTTK